MAPPGPVKKVIKKMAAERRLHRFHVSRPLIRPLDPLLILSLSLNWRWIYIVTFWTPYSPVGNFVQLIDWRPLWEILDPPPLLIQLNSFDNNCRYTFILCDLFSSGPRILSEAGANC